MEVDVCSVAETFGHHPQPEKSVLRDAFWYYTLRVLMCPVVKGRVAGER